MAANEHYGADNRPDGLATIFSTGIRFARILASAFSGVAASDSDHSYRQPVCSQPDAECLRDWSGHLGLPSVCDDFWRNGDRAAESDASLLTTVLGEHLTTTTTADLIERFGTIPQLLLADFAELVRVTGGLTAARKLDAIRAIAMRFLSSDEGVSPVLGDTHTLIRYLQADMGKRRVETFRAIFLDSHNRLITDEIMWSGTAVEVQVHPREVMRRAIEIDSSALIVAHNHPSQVLLPSSSDITMTKKLIQSASALGLTLHDHLIISSQGYHSMRLHKSIDPWE